MEDFEIDDFEKLYAITSAELNSPEEIDENTFNYINFDKISNLAEFKRNNKNLFSDKYHMSNEKDMNYYVIPIILKQRVRNGDEEITIDQNSYLITDSSGYGLFILMENGVLMKTAELEEQLKIAEIRYKEYLSKNIISMNDIREDFEVTDIDKAMKLIEEKELTLSSVQKLVDEKMRAKGIVLPENKEGVNTLSEERLEPGEELELDESRTRAEASSLGISANMLEMLDQKYGVRVDQLSFRKIDDYERLQEDTGIDARLYRGKTIALRINYGFQQRYFVVNSQTGEQIKLHRGEIETGNIPELEDYFKYPLTRSNGKEDTSRPLSYDKTTGPSYITYLDVYGNVKEAKYINNGKEDDMLREERQRYIAEVAEADKVLSDTIDIYQKENTQENWLRVKDAMRKRIQIDKKYRVLEKQKENTIGTLDETINETLEKYGRPEKEKSRDDEDDWFTKER